MDNSNVVTTDINEITEQLRAIYVAQYEGIDDVIPEKIDQLFEVSNYTYPQQLIAAIQSFKNPEQGFQIWKRYYESGDETALKDDLKAVKFSMRAEFNLQCMQLDMLHKMENKSFWKNNAIRRGALIGANMLFSRLMMKDNLGLSQNKTVLFGMLMGSRSIVDNEMQNAEPHSAAFFEMARNADYQARFASDLDTLLAQQDLPLVRADVQNIQAIKTQAIADTKKKYKSVFTDTLASLLITREGHKDNGTLRHSLVDYTGDIPDVNFGIELETVLLSTKTIIQKAIQLRREFVEAALPISSTMGLVRTLAVPKADNDYKTWMIMRDPSVFNPFGYVEKLKSVSNPEYDGIEIVSPVLKGNEGFAQASKVIGLGKPTEHLLFKKDKSAAELSFIDITKGVDVSSKAGETVTLGLIDEMLHLASGSNQTCGYHIHVELKDQPLDKLKNLCKALIRNEALFDQLVPEDRRGNNSKFAQSSAHVTDAQIDECEAVRDIVAVMNKGGDRNHKFDLTNLANELAPDTIQYRGNGGQGYMRGAQGYLATILHFTVEALDNPTLDLNHVLVRLGQAPVELASEPSAAIPHPVSRTVVQPS